MLYRVIGNLSCGRVYHNFLLGSIVSPHVNTIPDETSGVFALIDDKTRVQFLYFTDVEPVELGKQEAATMLKGAVVDIDKAIKVATDIADEHNLSILLRLGEVDVSYSGNNWSAL